MNLNHHIEEHKMILDRNRLTVKMEDLICKVSVLLPSITTIEAKLNDWYPMYSVFSFGKSTYYYKVIAYFSNKNLHNKK